MNKKRFGFFGWFLKIVNRVFKGITEKYDYSKMGKAMEKWLSMYYDEPEWLKKTNYRSLNLP